MRTSHNEHSADTTSATGLSVLHISTTDNWGGSGRAAYRVHTGLKRLGIQSRLYVGMKVTDDPDVRLIAGRAMRLLDRACGTATERLSLQYLAYPSSFTLPLRRWFREADVVQLYNTHGGYFSHAVLPLISRSRPVVWRLSDMWPMTGHCTYSYDCARWKTGCGSCPILSDLPALRRDTTALLWRTKRRLYRRSNLTIVAPSSWIAQVAAESPLLGSFPRRVIPNGIDLEVFRPIDKAAARASLTLPGQHRVVLFSAQFVFDRRKGGALVKEVLGRLHESGQPDLTLLVVGSGASAWEADGRFHVKSIETVSNDELMAILYSAADVFLVPTLSENLPNGILESMACGTPAVAFDTGGCADAVRHLETGYLAKHGDVEDLTRGVERLLTDAELRTRLATNARRVAEKEYGLMLQARRLAALYGDVTRHEVSL
jgi:glycosyltransferase involved in cell wall biosynthesis